MPSVFLMRHASRDWGEVAAGGLGRKRVFTGERASALLRLHLGDGTKIWIITEADRSADDDSAALRILNRHRRPEDSLAGSPRTSRTQSELPHESFLTCTLDTVITGDCLNVLRDSL